MTIITPDVEIEALRIWRERELRLPGPGRRMEPDRMDEITGAWGRCLADAARGLMLRAERERCIRAAKNAVLSLTEDQRRNGDLCHDAIDQAIRQLEASS